MEGASLALEEDGGSVGRQQATGRVGCGRGGEQRGGEKFETEEGEKREMDGEEVGKRKSSLCDETAGWCTSVHEVNRFQPNPQ